MLANPLSFTRKIVQRLFGSRNQRLLRRYQRQVDQINAQEKSMAALDDAALRAKTEEFRARYAEGATLDALLPEAFAVVREAAQRVLGMRHFDVQLIGGIVLHNGKIAEMRTGEGKTLVATLPAYLNAISGKGVHVVTVNDYLARRDSEWMGRIYGFLGLTTGVILTTLDPSQRKVAYACDITYGTNNEFGFDYLRDNMSFEPENRVQRVLSYAIVDEVDSILIDEARTPLIIAGPSEDHTDLYVRVTKVPPRLTRQEPKDEKDDREAEEGPGDYAVDEKSRQVHLTEAGHERVERILLDMGLLAEGESLYSPANINLMHHVYAALRAYTLFQRDVDYVVKDRQVIIIDEFTGRAMPGRRWSEGLHQAIEAKEGVEIQQENQTLASITFQNYFRMYGKLSGMTGTADTEAYEFQHIYGLEVVVIPTHRDMVREDFGDLVFLTQEEKFVAIIEDIRDCVARQQPVLVGTTSIETSEHLSRLLAAEEIPHQVLNAKFHEQEAHIVAQAGRPGAVTVATNMAGRGTDIVLGGNLEAELHALPEADDAARTVARAAWQERHNQVVEFGGLHIIGTERHESRRIDNQLRGRSGRQGDPGSSRFYLSLRDNLMRIFASDRVAAIMQKLGMQEGEAIEHPWVSRAIENAQRKVESRNFDMRKHLLEYDDVANDQRRVIYQQRNEVMDAEGIKDHIAQIRRGGIANLMATHIPPGSFEEGWDIAGLTEALAGELGVTLPLAGWIEADPDLDEETLRDRVVAAVDEFYTAKEAIVGEQAMRHLEKAVFLQVLDLHWKEHLAAMDHLRQGIHLRGYANKNPMQEYKREAYELFVTMVGEMHREITGILCRLQLRAEQAEEEVEALEEQRRAHQVPLEYHHAEAVSPLVAGEEPLAGGEGVAPAGAAGGTVGKAAGGKAAGGASGAVAVSAAPRPASREPAHSGPKVGRNEPCPCGSGKKYKRCHGQLE
jgi:preprotein translocase subunit SecA